MVQLPVHTRAVNIPTPCNYMDSVTVTISSDHVPAEQQPAK